MTFLRRTLLAVPMMALAGCGMLGLTSAEEAQDGPETPSADLSTMSYVPPMRWDHKANASTWTETAFAALGSHGSALPAMVPADYETWCPGYPNATLAERKAFWSGLISTLAKHESTYNPRAVGGGGLWFGLVQIAPATARGYGCEARSGAALKDGVKNLNCAIRIMARTVPRDGVVSRGMRGVAADWGPFHSSRKRNDMISWVSSQPYCEARPDPDERKGLLALIRSR